ncbi:glycosyltransferase family 2 protein [Halotia branconii]|uniref:Glycosyltransferase n=1 Tax=Halotia branconii CENA392 TaxID=1539056 RepID=A0AAJ6NWB7_9CYAN|nr:glycosyltransferase [Halotia branconii]WGV27603.1 glycosyltransferase [Halotia branconii CENA392]
MINSNKSANLEKSSMLSDTPVVSIIIGNYNYERFVGQAIDSVLKQTYQNIEVIVVDDGSKDKSREVISQYGDLIVPIFKENGGQPSNYNAGFAQSTGEIICFLDSDDMFVPDKIEKVVKTFKSSEEIGWCFHSMQLIDEDNNTLPITNTPNYVTRECDFRPLISAGRIPPHIPPCSGLCFRRSLLDKILPMPAPKIITNNDYYVKFMAVGLSKGFILSDALTLQKIHSNNAATLRKDRQDQKARKFMYTALWVKQKFPKFYKFANKLMAVGMGFQWQSGNKDSINEKTINDYLFSISNREKLNIYSRAIYYYFRSLIKV